MTTCKHCENVFESNSTGRPADFCSTRCRRAREYAIRRAERAADRAEQELTNARRDKSLGRSWMDVDRKVAFWEAEAKRTADALEALL